MSEPRRIELPPEEPPENVERLRLHHWRTRGGRFAFGAEAGVSRAPGRPEAEHGRKVAQAAIEQRLDRFKPYVWRDPARWTPPPEETP